MGPLKGFIPVAMWLLRISLLITAFSTFYKEVKMLSFSGIHYFIALAFCVFSILLFTGGFMKKPAATVFSSLILFALSAYKIFDLFDVSSPELFSPFILTAGISLFFAATGNKK